MNKHGLTKENLVVTLPPALRTDPSVVALAEALSELLAARPAEIERLRIYPAIDTLEEPLLDILARDFKVDWWDPEYSLEEKRRTLKDSWRVHRLLGTRAAVETAISAIYPHTQVLEWFEYGGEPYHFRLDINITNDSIDSEKQRRVLERMNFYKSLRSHNDGVTYFVEAEPAVVKAVASAPGLTETLHVPLVLPVPLLQPTASIRVGATTAQRAFRFWRKQSLRSEMKLTLTIGKQQKAMPNGPCSSCLPWPRCAQMESGTEIRGVYEKRTHAAGCDAGSVHQPFPAEERRRRPLSESRQRHCLRCRRRLPHRPEGGR